MIDKKKQGHANNQFNRKFPVGEEGFTFSTSITWQERAILTRHLVAQGIEPTKSAVSSLAKQLMKEMIAQLGRNSA